MAGPLSPNAALQESLQTGEDVFRLLVESVADQAIILLDVIGCWRAFKTDHLCALNFDQAFWHRI